MKYVSKLIALLLVLVMTLSLFACTKPTPDQSSSKMEESKDSSGMSESEKDMPESEFVLPYTGEEITLTYRWFDVGQGAYQKGVTTGMVICDRVYEMLGNINVDMELIPGDDYQNKLQLYFVSGDVADFTIFDQVTHVLSTYGPNGIFYDFAPMMDYMPNVKEYMANNGVTGFLYDSEGHLYALLNSGYDDDVICTGILQNDALMNELGIKTPETLDEFLDACRKIKQERPDFIPYNCPWGMGTAASGIEKMFSYGYLGSFFFDTESNQYVYTHLHEKAREEYKKLLMTLNTMWNEELISHEINTLPEETVYGDLNEGRWGFTNFYPAAIESWPEISIITPSYTVYRQEVAIPRDGQLNWAVASGANTKYPELIARIMDLLYSEEFSDLLSYGIEGVSFEYGDDGEKHFLENIKLPLKPDGDVDLYSDLGLWQDPWTRSFGLNTASVYYEKYYSNHARESLWKLIDRMNSGEVKGAYSRRIPGNLLTEDEKNAVSEVTSPVSTYVEEQQAKFIMGELNFDSDWDNFIETLNGFNCQLVLDIYNKYADQLPVLKGNWR